jgi:hypothetical protein
LKFSLLLRGFYYWSIFCHYFSFQDKSSTSNLKIEALIFTRLVLSSHSPDVFHPYIKVTAWGFAWFTLKIGLTTSILGAMVVP